jgi:hypothetical protein
MDGNSSAYQELSIGLLRMEWLLFVAAHLYVCIAVGTAAPAKQTQALERTKQPPHSRNACKAAKLQQAHLRGGAAPPTGVLHLVGPASKACVREALLFRHGWEKGPIIAASAPCGVHEHILTKPSTVPALLGLLFPAFDCSGLQSTTQQ